MDLVRNDLVNSRNQEDTSWDAIWCSAGKESRNAVGAFAVQDEATNLRLPGSEGSELTDVEDETLTGVALRGQPGPAGRPSGPAGGALV